MDTVLGVMAVIILVVMAGMSGNTGLSQGKTQATDATCKQAYTAKVHEQIPICKEWKLRIDTELNDKLGVK